jgi:hypothetical protein
MRILYQLVTCNVRKKYNGLVHDRPRYVLSVSLDRAVLDRMRIGFLRIY